MSCANGRWQGTMRCLICHIVLANSHQVFARKIIRPFAGVTRDDIMNEVRAIDVICHAQHAHIVEVLYHGWLGSSFYYFDMEVCNLNLEQYISKANNFMPYDDSKVWAIFEEVTKGLDHIHQLRQVHRDMKPRNATSLSHI